MTVSTQNIIPGPYFDEFFTPLVGDEVAAKTWQEELANSVRGYNPLVHDDPYDALIVALKTSYKQAANEVATQSSQEATHRFQVYDNAISGGGELVVRALRTIGEIYVDRAPVPQRHATVKKSVDMALGFMYNMAFVGKDVAIPALEGMYLGLNPQSKWTRRILTTSRKLHDPTLVRPISRRNFETTVDDEGQLDIQRRYQKLTKIRDRRCPATFTRVEGAKGSQPALRLTLQTIGAVTMSEIYPQYFDIES